MADKAHQAIAIDGPAASGKSTVARQLARRLGLTMINSGEMYRAVAYAVLQNGLATDDHPAIAAMVPGLDLRSGVEDGTSTVFLDGRRLGSELRSEAVNAAVSPVAAVPEVRELLVARQRDLLAFGDLVMEGRDIGSVVFPDTPFKIYIDASEEVRAMRRAAEGQVDEVAARDRRDAQRKTSPLVIAEGAVVIDTSEMTIEEAVQAAVDVLRERGWFEREPEQPVS